MADTDVSNDDLEGKVLSWLATQPADTLEEVYTLLKLAFPADPNGKRKTLLYYLVTHFYVILKQMKMQVCQLF